MNFFSITFLLFLIIVLWLLYKIRSAGKQRGVLLTASMVFYAVWDWRLLTLLLCVSFVVWHSAKYVHDSRKALLLGLLVPLLSLGICKYLNFFIESFAALLGGTSTGTLQIVLPLGISFYTFLAISYLLDVYHRKIPAEDSFVTVALYIGFFPTVISGPVTKARDLIGQFKDVKQIKRENLQAGVQIFVLGCLKKFVLADNLGIFVDDVYNAPLAFDSATVWLAVVGYSMQLYFDFSGYSDMAIGMGRAMGFNLCENFNLPYLAQNISEFWKRWHISLSSWLQEYLYFALGGSRCSKWKIYRNLMITMTVCGLWHGAAWNFVLWGAVHGMLLCGYRLWKENLGNIINLPPIVKVGLTFVAVSFCWVLFRAPDLSYAGEIFSRLLIWENFGVQQMYVYAWLAMVVLLLISIHAVKYNAWQGKRLVMDIAKPTRFFVFCLEVILLFSLMYTGSNPFVYATF